jgi:hypothetical protein
MQVKVQVNPGKKKESKQLTHAGKSKGKAR